MNADPFALPFTGMAFGVAFDSASARPQTGIALACSPKDPQAGKRPALVATGFGAGGNPSTFTHDAIDAA